VTLAGTGKLIRFLLRVSRVRIALWIAGVALLVIGLFAQLLSLPDWVVKLSPFKHVPAMPADDFALGPLLALTAVAVALSAVGLVGFRRRDAGY
jgi:polyether ionophore transport system permease protein